LAENSIIIRNVTDKTQQRAVLIPDNSIKDEKEWGWIVTFGSRRWDTHEIPLCELEMPVPSQGHCGFPVVD